MKKHTRRAERGATAIEYGLIAALMTIIMIPALQALGGSTNSLYGNVGSRITNAINQSR